MLLDSEVDQLLKIGCRAAGWDKIDPPVWARNAIRGIASRRLECHPHLVRNDIESMAKTWHASMQEGFGYNHFLKKPSIEEVERFVAAVLDRVDNRGYFVEDR